MNRGELIAEMRNKLGYNTGLEEVLFTGAIKNAQREIEQLPELPYFLRRRDYEMEVAVGVSSVALPDDLLRFLPFPAIYYRANISDRFRALKNIAYEEFQRIQQLSFEDFRRSGRFNYSLIYDDEDYPIFSAIDGNNLYLYPTTNNVLTLQLHYFKRDVSLEADEMTNMWATEAPYVLLSKAGMLLTENSRDKEGMQVFSQMYETAKVELQARSVARDSSGIVMQRGGDD